MQGVEGTDDMQAIYDLVDRQMEQEQRGVRNLEEPLIMHETLEGTWSSSLSPGALSAAFHSSVLHDVGIATDSRIERANDSFTILTDSEVTLASVKRKLVVLQTAFVRLTVMQRGCADCD